MLLLQAFSKGFAAFRGRCTARFMKRARPPRFSPQFIGRQRPAGISARFLSRAMSPRRSCSPELASPPLAAGRAGSAMRNAAEAAMVAQSIIGAAISARPAQIPPPDCLRDYRCSVKHRAGALLLGAKSLDWLVTFSLIGHLHRRRRVVMNMLSAMAEFLLFRCKIFTDGSFSIMGDYFHQHHRFSPIILFMLARDEWPACRAAFHIVCLPSIT